MKIFISILYHEYKNSTFLQEYLLEEELRLRNEQEERWRMEEQKMMEKEFLNALIEETNRRVENEKMKKIEMEKKKASVALYNSEHWKRAQEDIKPEKRSHQDGSESSYYWSQKFVEREKNRTPPFGCRDPNMTEQLKHVKPWVEV